MTRPKKDDGEQENEKPQVASEAEQTLKMVRTILAHDRFVPEVKLVLMALYIAKRPLSEGELTMAVALPPYHCDAIARHLDAIGIAKILEDGRISLR